MSIISKALQKAQEQRKTQQGKKKNVENSPNESFLKTTSTRQNRKFRRKFPWILIPLFIIAISIAGFLYYDNYLKTDTVTESRPDKSDTSAIVPTETSPQPEEIPVPIAIPKKAQKAKPPINVTAQESKTKDLPVIKKKPVVPVPSEDLPRLTGIMYSPSRPTAVINGAMVFEGEKINKVQVVKILPDKVIILFNNVEIELKLR